MTYTRLQTAARTQGIAFQRSQRISPRRHGRGFSLLEVLVSILVLSFGLLGMVGLQAAALQANREARTQSLATGLATELAELIRSNKDAALTGSGNPYWGNFASPLEAATASHCLDVVTASRCPDALALANAQMTDWLARADAALPGARVRVCLDAAPYDGKGLAQWDCTAGAGASTVIKLGWVQASAQRWKGPGFALDRASRPAVVLPFTPGSTV
ncbi:MAG: type IV pilus modification protein PilV, partial [Burkholderiales bacterium]